MRREREGGRGEEESDWFLFVTRQSPMTNVEAHNHSIAVSDAVVMEVIYMSFAGRSFHLTE